MLTALALLAAQPAAAADAPATLERLIACRDLAGDEARLACFDRESGRVAQAQDSRDLVVISRQEAEAARAPAPAAARSRAAPFEPISTTLASATQNAQGRWILTLADGSRWLQTETRRLTVTPRPGQPVEVRAGALGSYMANVGGGIAARVRPIE